MPRRIPIAILRQVFMRIEAKISNRNIAADLQVIDRKTIARYRKLLEKSKIKSPSKLSDEELFTLFLKRTDSRKKEPNQCKQAVLERLDYFSSELTRTGVTLQLLWQDYIKGKPKEEVCGYSTFCRILQPLLRKTSISYHNPRSTPGDVLMIDFAGKKLHYINKHSGKEVPCIVFVAVLAYSKYSYVEVIPNASTGFVIEALTGALQFFEGVPNILLTDNMAQLVKRANRYEASFTNAALEWANHYGVFLKATRTGAPKDKPDIERFVRLAYERIYAPLRNNTFYSLQELRSAVRVKLEEHNNQKFSGKTYSRSDSFFADEQPALAPLPATNFELSRVTRGKVQRNYHVLLGEDKHFYSVPYKYVGEYMDLRYTATTVEIYLSPEPLPVAIHPRDPRFGEYTTNKEHMPASHRAYTESKGWTRDDFILQAHKIGPFTVHCIEHILKSRKLEQQTYRSCMGLLALGYSKKYGRSRLEAACELSHELKTISYPSIKGLLEKERDMLFIQLKQKGQFKQGVHPFEHENLRGREAFDK